ncbi:MAG: glycosyltransferase family 4 protein [Candidatus Methanomethylicus sp.]|nr:glycosyltransferase family 4 protein [Candidatus Methanomethylicus sp.]
MRVVVLGKWPLVEVNNGVAVHTLGLTEQLGGYKEFDFYFISFGEVNRDFRFNNVNIKILKISLLLRLLPFLAVILLWIKINSIKPDLIHLQGINISPYAFCTIFFFKNVKKVYTIHGLMSQDKFSIKSLSISLLRMKLQKIFLLILLKSADAIIAVAADFKETIFKSFGEDIKAKITIIPNGSDAKLFKADQGDHGIRDMYGISQNAFVMFHAKAMVTGNGQEYLIRALPTILRERLDAVVVLAGEGPTKKNLENLARELGIAKQVFFLGNVSHTTIPYLISTANAIVMPSIVYKGVMEGSSVFLFECMSMKKPIIVTNVGGLKENVKNDITGLVVNQKDPNALAGAALKLMSDPELAKRLGEAAFRYATTERTWKVTARKTVNVFRQVLNLS